jgi:hypothetical protein
MARPVVSAVAEEWYEELETSQPGDEARGWPLLILLGGMGAAFGKLHDLVRDTEQGVGWSRVLDPDRALVDELPYTAQFAGVKLTPGITEAEQRAEITSPAAFNRGTPDGLRSAVAQTLTGNQYVFFKEQEGSPYRVTVVTRTSETPAQKPAGLILTHMVTDVRTWLEVQQAGGNTWAGVAATYGTWAAARGF